MVTRNTEEYKIRQRRVDRIRGALRGQAVMLARRQNGAFGDEERKQMADKVLRLDALLQEARKHRLDLYKYCG
jgi:hypothetical protein